MITRATRALVKSHNDSTGIANDLKLASLWVTFRNIHIVVSLILLFAIVQMVMLKRVCDRGMETSTSLEHQGLPYLDQLGDLQAHLALFRLYSYEYLFAKDVEQEPKRKALEQISAETHQELERMEHLIPGSEGQGLATNLESAFDDLNHEFTIVHGLVNSDFSTAMAKLDQDIPPKINRVTAAANALESYGYRLSSQQANATFGSFGWIKKNAITFGAVNITISVGAVLFVLLAARRTRVQLSVAAGRLTGKTNELASSLSLLRGTLDSTADAIVALDQNNKVLCFNQKFVKLWGFSEDMLERKRTSELMTLCSIQTTNPERFLKQLEKSRMDSNTETLDAIEFLDGRMAECFAKPQQINGQSAGVVLSFRDVTKQRRAEAATRESQALYQSLVDQLPAGVVRLDFSGRYVFVNSWYSNFKGLKPEAFLGKTPLELMPEDSTSARSLQDHQEILKTEKHLEREKACLNRSKETTYLQVIRSPVFDLTGKVVGSQAIIFDITQRKQAEAKLNEVHKQLMDASRQAGMAEVATSVLHNVGNVLNSVNVSSSLIADKVRMSKVANLPKISALLRANEHDLGTFFTVDPKGKQLLDYTCKLAEHLTQEQQDILQETAVLVNNIVHIKEIVSMQQNYARSSGVLELIDVKELVHDAMRMNDGAMERHKVKVSYDFNDVDPILTEKHKVLQILINLIRNAKYACDESGKEDKHILMRITNGGPQVKISVIDNGVGIPAENLTRIFSHGFTTRKDGHGFGLHSGAIAAKELGGALTVFSEGHLQGAAFTLELPYKTKRSDA